MSWHPKYGSIPGRTFEEVNSETFVAYPLMCALSAGVTTMSVHASRILGAPQLLKERKICEIYNGRCGTACAPRPKTSTLGQPSGPYPKPLLGWRHAAV